MITDIMLTPIIVFFVALLATLVIYALGSSRKSTNKDKPLPYACGEEMHAEKAPVSVYLFEFVVLFLVFDVIAVLLVFSFGATDLLLPLIYLALAGVALTTLPVFGRRP